MKTTEQMFERFKKECEYWIQKLGLTGWEVDIVIGMKEDLDTTNAKTSIDLEARYAKIKLAPEWEEEYGENEIENTAFHEVCEVKYGKIHTLANYRYLRHHDEIEEAIHELIHQDTKLIWKKDWAERQNI